MLPRLPVMVNSWRCEAVFFNTDNPGNLCRRRRCMARRRALGAHLWRSLLGGTIPSPGSWAREPDLAAAASLSSFQGGSHRWSSRSCLRRHSPLSPGRALGWGPYPRWGPSRNAPWRRIRCTP